MKSLLLAAVLTLMLVPSASHAQTYNYAYRNTPFGQAYFYRQQYGPFVTASQGFRPYPGMFPYGLNSYAGTPYYNFNYANFPFLGYPTYQFPVYQQPAQVVIQQPIFVNQQVVPPPNNKGNSVEKFSFT